MNNSQIKNQNPSKAYALFYSFFLIPFMLAIFGGMFFFMFQFLTYEKNTPIDLLNNIQSGSATKRWQSAFELSNMLDESKINNVQLFVNKMKSLYEKSKNDDPRVRTYLALAMGKTNNIDFGEDLILALRDKNLENRLAAIKSLGLLKYDKSCPDLEKIIKKSNNNAEKLSVIIALGMIGNRKHKKILINMLDNEEPNLRWDAAIALAKMNDNSGVYIIENLLTREFFKKFPPHKSGKGIDINEIDNAIYIAIATTQKLIDNRFKDELINLSKYDNNVKIKEFALKTLNEYYK